VFAELCDADLTLNELDKAVECLSLNKALTLHPLHSLPHKEHCFDWCSRWRQCS